MNVAHEWGRIAEDGTVYVRTREGERAVGSWQAGDPGAGLAHFERRFAELAAQVDLLGQRLAAGTADPTEVKRSAERLRASLADARVVGDLAALEQQLERIGTQAADRLAARAAAKAAARAEATAALTRLAEEAEALATTTRWKSAGERLRQIADEWKPASRAVDRATASELWRRYAKARDEFTHRRGRHFAELETTNKEVAARKEELIAEAEGLADSSDWTATANRFRDLMTEWKAAGRGPKATEDAQWARFHAAQQTFFTRRSAAFAERDATRQANIDARARLVAEAEALDLSGDPAALKRRLREIQDRWAAAGAGPRPALADLEARLAAVEQRVRGLEADRWAKPNVAASPLVTRLRESVAKLERRVERARAAGQPDADAETALATQREWLAQAERG